MVVLLFAIRTFNIGHNAILIIINIKKIHENKVYARVIK